MRVIAGSARRIPLDTPVGKDTRPTTDRVKETLFNMLQFCLADCRFLDLFSGSGGIGIEALSRGAKCAVFVENGREALSCIEKNLKRTHLEDQGEVLAMDVFGALKLLSVRMEPFDLIFMDPPYGKDYEKEALEYLAGSGLMKAGTQVIFEASLDTPYGYVETLGYEITKVKKYKTNQHIFLVWNAKSGKG